MAHLFAAVLAPHLAPNDVVTGPARPVGPVFVPWDQTSAVPGHDADVPTAPRSHGRRPVAPVNIPSRYPGVPQDEVGGRRRTGMTANHQATRLGRCTVLTVGFILEQWPGVRRAGRSEGYERSLPNGPAQRAAMRAHDGHCVRTPLGRALGTGGSGRIVARSHSRVCVPAGAHPSMWGSWPVIPALTRTLRRA